MKNQKLILVFYLDIGNLQYPEVDEYMKQFTESLKEQTEDYKNFIVPVRGDGSKSKVECINPVQIEEDQYKLVLDRLVDMQSIVDDFVSKNIE